MTLDENNAWMERYQISSGRTARVYSRKMLLDAAQRDRCGRLLGLTRVEPVAS